MSRRGRGRNRGRSRGGRNLGLLGVAVLSALQGCVAAPPPPPLPPAQLESPTPAPERIDRLLILVGDAGAALPGAAPVLTAAARDVERWSPRLESGALTVAFLGDLVYPEGVRPPDHPGHARDTLALHAQLQVVTGPAARAAGTEAWFVPGNHDWGDRRGPAGLERLRATADRVALWRAAGLPVRMWPEAGAVTPAARTVGDRHLILGLDTHDWLQADGPRRRELRDAYRTTMAGSADRTITVLAHHPLLSGGEHGEDPPGDVLMGLSAAFSRAGALVQDASAPRYRAFVDDIVSAGRDAGNRSPDLWAGGHDHTLQLLRGRGTGWPRWAVVSGAGSKLGRMGSSPDLLVGGAWPGYARLFLLDDGSAVLQFVAGAPGAISCAGAPDRGACMRGSVESFRTVLSRTLPPS